ncbi:ABC-type multidrug transport system, ATpase and permease component [Clostridium aceticum]|uniref:ABC-type multidrug transport system, ATpase and permease component n=1 Tax=Clostridium aceticum TaxID=84022 RepID=A0A0D8I9G3_9CLOT|nr:ABC transporter ATP-binding protein [Clostridium aceticum]AKL96285.1 ABC-type multidrug transport system, ATpase and permease component [Clostridium aceticum]KJF26682.1 ABC transporter [Clostridium aceticum]
MKGEGKSNNYGPGGGRGPGSGFAMGRPVEKATDFKNSLKRLMGYLKPHRAKLMMVFFLAILSTVFNILSPKFMGAATNKIAEGLMNRMSYFTNIEAAIERGADIEFIDQLRAQPVPGIDFNYIWQIVLVLIALYVISSLFNFATGYMMAGVAQKTVYKMRKDANAKLARLPLKYFDSHTHGEILSRITNDLDNVGSTLQQSLTQLITAIVTLVGVTIMMLSISPVLTLIAIITLPLSAAVTVAVAKKSQRLFAARQAVLGELNGHAEEMYTGHKEVKVFGHEKRSIDEFDEINERLYDAGWKAEFISGIIMPLLNFVNNIGYVLICVVGGIFVAIQRIQIGDIQAFIQYARQFTHPIVQTANITNIIQSTVASAERVFNLLDEVEEIPDKEDAKIIEFPRGEVSFQHVQFGYKEDNILIKDMNIEVKKGQTIAIVGPTGAGKTTLVNLLMRFYEIKGGNITIDGTDIRDLRRGNLRNMFGMVLQDTWLFSGTIRENIAYGRQSASEEEIVAASKAAHADYFIRRLPEGYDTVLDEEASNISQGQKQLLTIARAILANPAILILDEATSSVDTRTEVLIQKAMARLMEGRTNFVIAHRLSTIRGADLILVIDHGEMIEQGTHQQLLEKNGFYADLYNSQFTSSFRRLEGL